MEWAKTDDDIASSFLIPVRLGVKVEDVAEGAHRRHQVEVGQHHSLR